MHTNRTGHARLRPPSKASTIVTTTHRQPICRYHTSRKRRMRDEIPHIPHIKHRHRRRIQRVICNPRRPQRPTLGLGSPLRLLDRRPGTTVSRNRTENPPLRVFPFRRQRRPSVVERQQCRVHCLPPVGARIRRYSLRTPTLLPSDSRVPIIRCPGTRKCPGLARRNRRTFLHGCQARRGGRGGGSIVQIQRRGSSPVWILGQSFRSGSPVLAFYVENRKRTCTNQLLE